MTRLALALAALVVASALIGVMTSKSGQSHENGASAVSFTTFSAAQQLIDNAGMLSDYRFGKIKID